MIRLLILLPVVFVGCRASGAVADAAPLVSIRAFELERYLGTWYEIAKYPVSFEEGLVGVTAAYSMRDDGKVRVENAGFEGSFDGPKKTAVGKAWVPDEKRPAELRVSFFWPFSGRYWVIDRGSGYEWAIVGEPSRKYLWILARTPVIPDGQFAQLVKRVRELGYNPERLERMPQS